MTQTMVSFDEKTNKTISLDPSNLITQSINIAPLVSANIVAGTTLAESTVSIGGSTISIYRTAEAAEDRAGILMTDIALDADVNDPLEQSDILGASMAVHGVFKSDNITDEGTLGTVTAKTKENTNLFFK